MGEDKDKLDAASDIEAHRKGHDRQAHDEPGDDLKEKKANDDESEGDDVEAHRKGHDR